MADTNAMLKKHRSLTFPQFPEDDQFAEWLSELAEVDGYYVGLASAGAREFQKKANMSFLADIETKLEKFAMLGGGDKLIYEKCKSYVQSLKEVVMACR